MAERLPSMPEALGADPHHCKTETIQIVCLLLPNALFDFSDFILILILLSVGEESLIDRDSGSGLL